MKPVIGITVGRQDDGALHISPACGEAVTRAGGIPVYVLPDPADADALALRLDGLLLSGGGDVDPALYGQCDMGSGPADPVRDASELALFAAMRRLGKPIFGICRGVQMIQVAMGGTLVQDIPSALGIDHPRDTAPCHTVRREAGTFLEKFFPEEFAVNSTHHQAADGAAPGMVVCARSEDGRITEALQAADGSPLWGVQWHPERLIDDPAMLSLFTMLVDACGK